MDKDHGYDDQEFREYCDSEKMSVGSLYGIVAWKAWNAPRKNRQLMLEALKNLENDDGQIPDHAWALCQQAIAAAGGKKK